MGQRGLHEMKDLEGVGGGGLSGCMGQRGLHEMRILRGWEGEGCLVVWVRGIT